MTDKKSAQTESASLRFYLVDPDPSTSAIPKCWRPELIVYFPDVLWQTPTQAAGGSCTLQELLDAAPAGETYSIEWYMEDPEKRIPKDWEGKVVCFRNSLFAGGSNLCVRCLFRDNGEWTAGVGCDNYLVDERTFVVASSPSAS